MVTLKKVYITEEQLSTKFCTRNRIKKPGLYGIKVDTGRDIVLNVELLNASPKLSVREMHEVDLRTILSDNKKVATVTKKKELPIIEVEEDPAEEVIVEVGEDIEEDEVIVE